MPAVRLEGVAKRFGWTWALRGVDLEIEPGALVALMGPNGAGKTTLLRILATLIRPTRGAAEVLGRRVDEEVEEIRRSLGFLAPQGYLYDQLTALENLRFACMMSGIEEEGERLQSVLERVGLGRVADFQVGGFSSGMRKRLAVARLLLRPLEVVLLDEPYASLDVEGVELVDRIVAEMKEEGKTVIVASHQWGRILRSADRVAVLEQGKVAWQGTPEEHGRRHGGRELRGAETPARAPGSGGASPRDAGAPRPAPEGEDGTTDPSGGGS